MVGCASSTRIGVLTSGVGVHRGSPGTLGTGATLLTAVVWELCGGDGAGSTGIGYYLLQLGLDCVKLVLCPLE